MLKHAVLAAAIVLTAGSVQAASPRDQLLVTPAWLASHARDPNLVILFAGEKAEYEAKHIPGAVHVVVADLAPNSPAGLTAELPSPEELRTKLQALGISNRSRIVVYGGRQLPNATRLLLTLDAAGLGSKTSLLDGGLAAWEAAGQSSTVQAPTVRPGVLSPLKMKRVTTDVDAIRARSGKPKYDVIDARAGVFYDGIQAGMGGRDAAKGHVVGARSIPFTEVTDASGKMKSADQLQALFKAAGVQSGVQSGDDVTVYCHIGYQATAVIYAARTLGIDAKLYDGSFQDWSNRKLPVETASAGK